MCVCLLYVLLGFNSSLENKIYGLSGRIWLGFGVCYGFG